MLLTSAVDILASVIQYISTKVDDSEYNHKLKYLHTQKYHIKNPGMCTMIPLRYVCYKIMQLCHSPFLHWKNHSDNTSNSDHMKKKIRIYTTAQDIWMICNRLLGSRCVVYWSVQHFSIINHNLLGHILPEDDCNAQWKECTFHLYATSSMKRMYIPSVCNILRKKLQKCVDWIEFTQVMINRHNNDHLGSIKGGKFHNQLCKYLHGHGLVP
jgi:hypothetical protein